MKPVENLGFLAAFELNACLNNSIFPGSFSSCSPLWSTNENLWHLDLESEKNTSSEVKASKQKRSMVNLSLSLFFCLFSILAGVFLFIYNHPYHCFFEEKKHSEASWFDRNCEMIGDVTPSYMHLISIKSSYQKLLDCLRLRRMVCVLWCFFFWCLPVMPSGLGCWLGQGLRGIAEKILPQSKHRKNRKTAQDASLCHLDGWMDGYLWDKPISDSDRFLTEKLRVLMGSFLSWSVFSATLAGQNGKGRSFTYKYPPWNLTAKAPSNRCERKTILSFWGHGMPIFRGYVC